MQNNFKYFVKPWHFYTVDNINEASLTISVSSQQNRKMKTKDFHGVAQLKVVSDGLGSVKLFCL